MSKLIILSDFDPKIIRANQVPLEQYEYLRKKNFFKKDFFTKTPFVALLDIHGMLKSISNFAGDSRLMEVPLICLTETHLLSTIAVNGISTAYEIVRNAGQFDKFKSFSVLYNKQNFNFLEQESFNGLLYIKLDTRICYLSDFSMLIVYRKNNSNIAQFVGYITYLTITKHVDFVLGDFNEGSFSDGPIKISLQSLGFSQVVSEATQIRGSCLDQIYIKDARNKFSFF